jgi:hypothetical protein
MVEGATIELLDEMNRQVKTYSIDGSNQTFMVEDLPRGIYFLTLMVEKEAVQMVKVVK